ncbi:MAG: hypothetical protein EOP45_17795 [Sphingobacteriaceae bacterium]|nr:MAG: hypothetical protein EOP45_17795 [Sphingobacteriaceae bacterium]
MIDSSLGKILSTKPVEPSISSNVDTTVTPAATPVIEDAPISTTKEDSESHPARSEAEVRLVVRFLVEEHIVFNGKVEQVKHLDKTELSRIVSRIAWDGAKGENNELAIENEGVVDNVENTGWLEDNSELKNCCEPSIKISPPQSDPPSPQHNNIDVMKPIDDGSTNIIEEQPYLTTNDTSSSSPDEVVPNNNEEGTTSNDERLLGDVKDTNTPEFDNKTTTFISKDICETTNEQMESSYTIQENGNQHQMKDVYQTYNCTVVFDYLEI